MKKNIYYLVFVTFLILITFLYKTQLFMNMTQIVSTILYSYIPTLFPIFILTNCFVGLNGIQYLTSLLNRIKINGIMVLFFIISLLGGAPLVASVAHTLYEKKAIDEQGMQTILSLFSLPSIAFILITLTYFNKISLIAFSIYLSTFILVVFLKKNKFQTIPFNFSECNLPKIIKQSIMQSVIALIIISGTVILFSLPTVIIQLSSVEMNLFLGGLLEFSYPSTILARFEGSRLICSILTIILIFGGLSSLIQVTSLADQVKINFKKYFLVKLVHIFLALFILFLIF